MLNVNSYKELKTWSCFVFTLLYIFFMATTSVAIFYTALGTSIVIVICSVIWIIVYLSTIVMCYAHLADIWDQIAGKIILWHYEVSDPWNEFLRQYKIRQEILENNPQFNIKQIRKKNVNSETEAKLLKISDELQLLNELCNDVGYGYIWIKGKPIGKKVVRVYEYGKPKGQYSVPKSYEEIRELIPDFPQK